MNEPTIEILVRRLERLERANRRLKWITVGFFVGLAALLTMGQAKPSKVAKVIEAEKFVVKDPNGRGSITLGLLTEGAESNYGLLISNDSKDGHRVAALSRNGLWLMRLKYGGVQLSAKPADMGLLSSVEVDFGGFKVRGKDFNTRASLGMASDGEPILAFDDRNRQIRVALSLLPSGTPSLQLNDKDGKTRAVLGSTTLTGTQTGQVRIQPESSLTLFDKDGKVIWKAPED
ncbi:MAG: hypothetical protein HY694_14230 [Deltaproteobacteria bacterium]|nr:hypothetical protein [Deltaproteobacteria bacterium]